MSTPSTGKCHLPKDRILRSVGRLGRGEGIRGGTGSVRFSMLSLMLRTDARTFVQFESSWLSNRHISLCFVCSVRYSAPSTVASFSETRRPCNLGYTNRREMQLDLRPYIYRGCNRLSETSDWQRLASKHLKVMVNPVRRFNRIQRDVGPRPEKANYS